MSNREMSNTAVGASIVVGAMLVVMLVGGGMWGCPKYNVWEQSLAGEAELARAEQNRQIKVNEAKANLDSAELNRRTTVINAKAVSEANAIIGESLKENEAYLRYLYIEMLRETGGDGRETIYIPTEALMPITEANRLKHNKVTE